MFIPIFIEIYTAVHDKEVENVFFPKSVQLNHKSMMSHQSDLNKLETKTCPNTQLTSC